MIERMDILNASNMLMAWSNSFMRDEEMLDKVAAEIVAKHR